MSIETRLAALETRLRIVEDRLEILDLLNSYGPLVDSGSSAAAAALWQAGGGYDFTLPGGCTTRLQAPDDLVAMYESAGHQALIGTGAAHFTGTPKISVHGDTACAVGYSFVVLQEGERWFVWRAAVNEWRLVRTGEGWRIAERSNRALNGSDESHAMMRRVSEI